MPMIATRERLIKRIRKRGGFEQISYFLEHSRTQLHTGLIAVAMFDIRSII